MRIEGEWYDLIAVDDTPSAKIIAFCQEAYGDKWRRRFAEDFVQALAEMGHRPGATVKLRLRRREGGDLVTLPGVTMTFENRQRLREGRRQTESRLSAEQVRSDIAELLVILQDNYSYLTLNSFDYRDRLESLQSHAAGGIDRYEFAIGLRKIIARFGDGHARVKNSFRFLPAGYTPFVLDEVTEGIVALKPDRSGLLDPEHPLVVSIDDVPIEKWIEAAAAVVARGSPQFRRERAIHYAHCARFIRDELDRDEGAAISITLASVDREHMRTANHRILPIFPQVFVYPPELEYRRLEGNIGYLRIGSMDDTPPFLDGLRRAMAAFRDTDGLIIDVRGNTGGTRDALVTLFPYVLRQDDPPHVANVAKYRLRRGDNPNSPDGFLSNRFLYPVSWSGWDGNVRQAIRAFAASFKPEWLPPTSEFSDWHYLVISPASDDRTYHYDEPIVILIDRACFSATDIFAAAFKGWRAVTLVGGVTGGGSGRSEVYELGESKLRVQLSTMISYQPTGRLYDGIGVEPDVVVARSLSDLLGKSDAALSRALEVIRQSR